MPSTKIIAPAEFWLADLPFTSGVESKIRPVLVLWIDGDDAVVCAVTSADPRGSTDIRLANWQESGLRVASTVRLARISALEQKLLFHKLGRLSTSDAASIQSCWEKLIRPKF